MKVAVVSPYYHENWETLKRCMDSVRAQTYPVTHVMVADGHARYEVDAYYSEVQHLRLPVSHSDYGDTPRMIGTASIYSQGFDAVCWLDADNWIEPDHVERMVSAANVSGAAIVTCPRNLYTPDGGFLGVDNESNGYGFNDTNCYLLTRAVMVHSIYWTYKDRNFAPVGDRIVWDQLRKQKTTRSTKATVNYTTCIASHYLERGLTPPAGAKVIIQFPGEPHPSVLPYEVYLERVKEFQ